MCEACDAAAQAQGGALVPFETALARALEIALPVEGIETVALEDAAGRVLAEPALAPLPLPPFDNSAMDGYAVRLADLAGEGPWRLPLARRIAAGDAGGDALPSPGAARILTGAPLPQGADAVVMQEETAVEAGPGGEAAVVRRRPRLGENIRRAGEDLPAGSAILQPGVAIGAREAAALAAVGAGRVAVRRRLRVAFFCTGSELRQPGEPLAPGQIWNSNRFQLRAALALPWIEAADLGAVPDEPERLRRALAEAAAQADLVVSTGGVSVGEEDHMPRLLAEAGGKAQVMRVAMKPGKPLTVGTLGAAVYLGLPGNPVSAFVAWQLVGAAVAARRAGIVRPPSLFTTVRASAAQARRPGRTEFRPARFVGAPSWNEPEVELLAPSFSARIALLAAADGLVVIEAQATGVEKGERLRFLPF
ncbi:MAG: molybdopterin molybdenumtransferase MoeA [Hyphomicrobiales bacterium]|nr:MAG: molybdopterin molybdenumtransferase MoeA [Hyphomicrobiales bacterium]